MKSAINRISWLDSVRGFAFLMVIYGHIVCCGNMVLNNYFAPVFLTSFFFVSGYLFKEDVSFWKFFEQRTRTLYIPSVILGLFILLTSVAFPVADPNNKINVGSEIIGIIFQFDGKHHGLWFLAALYSYSLLFWMLLKILKNNTYFGSVIFTLLYVGNWAYLYLWGGILLPWYLCQFGICAFYMYLGWIYKKYEIVIDKKITKSIVLFLTLMYFAVVYLFDEYYSILSSRYLLDALFVTILGLTVFVYLNKYYFCRSKYLLFIGSNSLLYFGFHGKVITALSYIVNKLGIIGYSSLILEMIHIAMVIAVSLIVIIPVVLTNRYAPWIAGKSYKLYRHD